MSERKGRSAKGRKERAWTRDVLARLRLWVTEGSNTYRLKPGASDRKIAESFAGRHDVGDTTAQRWLRNPPGSSPSTPDAHTLARVAEKDGFSL